MPHITHTICFVLNCLIVFYLIINRALFSFVSLSYCYHHYCYYYIIIFIKTIVFTLNCICFYYCQFSPPSNAEPRTSLNPIELLEPRAPPGYIQQSLSEIEYLLIPFFTTF